MFSTKTQKQNNRAKTNLTELEKLNLSHIGGEYQPTKEKPSLVSTPQRKEFTIFNYQQYYEQEVIKRKIKELLEVIRNEIAAIKTTQKNLLTEVKDIENLTFNTTAEKPNVYTINFLEIIISILRNLRKKIGESKTWLEALVTRKKKRGSLFLARSKKMGTQYSLSQELQAARSTQ